MKSVEDLTRKSRGPRPYTAIITDWHGENPRVFDDCFYPTLSNAAREYYDAQRKAAMEARDGISHAK